MKLASYIADGKPAFGRVTDGSVVTLSDRMGRRNVTLKDALAEEGLLDELLKLGEGAEPDLSLDGLTFLPTITNPGKDSLRRDQLPQPRRRARPCGGGEAQHLHQIHRSASAAMKARCGGRRRRSSSISKASLWWSWAKAGARFPPTDALSHVAGYTCFCDGSVRDFIKVSLITGKNFPVTSPLGPWMVTADEIPDPSKLTLTTRLNGVQMQHSGTDMLMHDVPALIAYCSAFTPLAPGDIIATGTPEGIGARRNPPVWMKAGDVLEVEISGIGTLAQPHRRREIAPPVSPRNARSAGGG